MKAYRAARLAFEYLAERRAKASHRVPSEPATEPEIRTDKAGLDRVIGYAIAAYEARPSEQAAERIGRLGAIRVATCGDGGSGRSGVPTHHLEAHDRGFSSESLRLRRASDVADAHD